MKVYVKFTDERGIGMIVKLDDIAEVKRYIEHLTDSIDPQMTKEQFAEKWHVYLGVSRTEAEAYKSGVGRPDRERAAAGQTQP